MLKSKRGEFRLIHKNQIRIDPVYQRSQVTSSKKNSLRRIASNFSWEKFGTITVSEREGEYQCIDGAGRVTVSLLIDEIVRLPCMVFSDMSEKEEASTFVDIAMNTVPLTWFNRYEAGLVEGNHIFLEMEELANIAGRSIAKTSSPSTIACVHELYNRLSSEPSNSQLHRLWEMLAEFFSGYIFDSLPLKGICYLDKVTGGLTDQNQRRIIQIGHNVINRKIKEKIAIVGKCSPQVSASAILEAYNTRLKVNRLDSSLLLNN